MPNCTAYW